MSNFEIPHRTELQQGIINKCAKVALEIEQRAKSAAIATLKGDHQRVGEELDWIAVIAHVEIAECLECIELMETHDETA